MKVYGVPRNLVDIYESILGREDIDMIDKVSLIVEKRSHLSNDQVAGIFEKSYQWVETKMQQKLDRIREKKLFPN
jgi:hypothetical protein